MRAIADLDRAAELLGEAISGLTAAATVSRERVLEGIDSDAEWQCRMASVDLALARFYIAVAHDGLLQARAEARRATFVSVH